MAFELTLTLADKALIAILLCFMLYANIADAAVAACRTGPA